MNYSLFLPTRDNKKMRIEHTIVTVPDERNTNEGCEFLDDAIRFKEQPLILTEECIAPGSPRDLL
jgi:hypothetical protein